MSKYFSAQVIMAIVIVFVTIVANKIISSIINRIIKKKKNKQLTTVLIFVRKIKTLVVYSIGILLALAQFELFESISVTLLSALGIGVGVLSLAFKESLTNFISSFELILNKPFEVGDFINLPELKIGGTVEEISFRHTIIKTINNQREIIPNSLLNTLAVENYDFTNNEIVLFKDYQVGYNEDIDRVLKIMREEILNSCDINYIKDSADIEFPRVKVVNFADSGIEIRAWIWGKDVGEAYDNLFNFNYNLKKRFDKEKIEIPYNYVNIISKK